VLDEEDLALIGEANPEWERKTTTQVSSSVTFMKDRSNGRCSPSSSA
jgi:hypothetical protein